MKFDYNLMLGGGGGWLVVSRVRDSYCDDGFMTRAPIVQYTLDFHRAVPSQVHSHFLQTN